MPTQESTMFTAHCPVCKDTSVLPHKNRPGLYWCTHCKKMDILASELVLKPVDVNNRKPDPRTRPTVYGHPN